MALQRLVEALFGLSSQCILYTSAMTCRMFLPSTANLDISSPCQYLVALGMIISKTDSWHDWQNDALKGIQFTFLLLQEAREAPMPPKDWKKLKKKKEEAKAKKKNAWMFS